jgi:hypothetical protein
MILPTEPIGSSPRPSVRIEVMSRTDGAVPSLDAVHDVLGGH